MFSGMLQLGTLGCEETDKHKCVHKLIGSDGEVRLNLQNFQNWLSRMDLDAVFGSLGYM
jgi:hypothetical protein